MALLVSSGLAIHSTRPAESMDVFNLGGLRTYSLGLGPFKTLVSYQIYDRLSPFLILREPGGGSLVIFGKRFFGPLI